MHKTERKKFDEDLPLHRISFFLYLLYAKERKKERKRFDKN